MTDLAADPRQRAGKDRHHRRVDLGTAIQKLADGSTYGKSILRIT